MGPLRWAAIIPPRCGGGVWQGARGGGGGGALAATTATHGTPGTALVTLHTG